MATERNILAYLITVVLAIGFAAGQPAGATEERNISAKARAYLEHALDVMQQNALHRETIDWGKLRSEALDHAAAAEIPVDTYEAIRWALHQVNRHSFLQLSTELEKQEADRKSHTGTELKPATTRACFNLPSARQTRGACFGACWSEDRIRRGTTLHAKR